MGKRADASPQSKASVELKLRRPSSCPGCLVLVQIWAYHQDMPVYVRGPERTKRRFHRTEDCYQLQKSPARGKQLDLQEVEIDDLKYANPCRDCYPDSPRARSFHLRCQECSPNYTRPCPHNGGVPIHKVCTWRTSTLFHEPGDTYIKLVHVWPEDVRLHLAS